MQGHNAPIEYGKSEVIYRIEDKCITTNKTHKDENELTDIKLETNIRIDNILILAVGSMVEVGVKVYERLISDNLNVTFVNVRFITPIDETMLQDMAMNHNYWVTMEENVTAGGYGESITSYLMEHNYNHIKQINISLPNMFIEQGEVSILKEKYGLDEDSIYTKIKKHTTGVK